MKKLLCVVFGCKLKVLAIDSDGRAIRWTCIRCASVYKPGRVRDEDTDMPKLRGGRDGGALSVSRNKTGVPLV
jgi:hypothetical protein